jgi:hypothetical protein
LVEPLVLVLSQQQVLEWSILQRRIHLLLSQQVLSQQQQQASVPPPSRQRKSPQWVMESLLELQAPRYQS